MHIAVPTDSNLLDMPSISQPASKLSRGTLAVEQEKEGELATTSLEFEFHFQFPYGSPTTELTVRFPPNSTKRKQLQVYTNIKSQCQGIVITSLLMSSLLISISHRLFRSRYSNSRDIVGSCSFLYPPHRQSAPESLLAGYQYL